MLILCILTVGKVNQNHWVYTTVYWNVNMRYYFQQLTFIFLAMIQTSYDWVVKLSRSECWQVLHAISIHVLAFCWVSYVFCHANAILKAQWPRQKQFEIYQYFFVQKKAHDVDDIWGDLRCWQWVGQSGAKNFSGKKE